MSSQSDIPYLYLQMDFNTVLQTILLQENLQKVIDQLKLNIEPRDLYKRIEIEVTVPLFILPQLQQPLKHHRF